MGKHVSAPSVAASHSTEDSSHLTAGGSEDDIQNSSASSSDGTADQQAMDTVNSSGTNLHNDLVKPFLSLNTGSAPMGDSGQLSRPGDEGVGSSECSRALSQWELDNLPIEEKYWPDYQHTQSTPADQEPSSKGLFNEGGVFVKREPLVALENAFIALELPITLDTAGLAQHHMIQLGFHFVFNTLPWLDDFRTGLAESGDLYEEEALAVQFYFTYGRALWGSKVGEDEADQSRLKHLESFFCALRAQDAARSDFIGDGKESLRYLVSYRRATLANINSTTGEVDANATMEDLFAALDIQCADAWVTTSLLHAICRMAFEALDRTCDIPAEFFPLSRPSDAFVSSIANRIANRYTAKFWPDDYLKSEDAEVLLQQFVSKLLANRYARSEVAADAVQRLDGFLGMEDGDAEEARSHKASPVAENTGLECTLSHMETDESCSLNFASAIELAAHMAKVHDFDEELAKDVATDSEHTQQKNSVRW